MQTTSPLLTGQDGMDGTAPVEQSQVQTPQAPLQPEFPKYAADLFQQIKMDGSQERIRRIRKWVKSDKFYQGQQLGYFSPVTGRYVDIDPDVMDEDDDEPLFVNNQFRYHIKSLRKEGTRSQTRLHVRARTDRPEAVEAAEFANALIEDYQRRTWDEHSKQSELMNMFLYGNYFRYAYYTTDVLGAVCRLPETKEQQVESSPPTLYCAECNTSAPVEANIPICPQCGSDQVQMTEGQSFPSEVPTGQYKEVKVGDCFTEVVSPLEIHVSLHARKIEHSPYLLREREVMRCVLKSKFPKAKLAAGRGGGDASATSATSFIRVLEASAGNVGGFDSPKQSNDSGGAFTPLLFEQLWLDPPVYSDYVTPKDFQTSTGEVFPQGTRLIEVCPDGLYIARVGDEILDLRNESKQAHWTHGTYDLIPSRFFGDGLEDMVELQRQLNEVISLRFENMMANAAPNTIFNPLKIDAEQFSGKPREMSPLINATPEDDIRRYVMRLEGSGLDRENFAAEDNYKKDLQTLSGAFSIMSGAPDVDVKTATGIQIMRDAAVSALGTALALRARVDVEWSYQLLKLVQSNWVEERFISFTGRFGASSGRWFSSSDLQADFEITSESGSWMPRSEMETRANLAYFLSPESTGLPLGFLNPAVPEEYRRYAAQELHLPIGLEKERVHRRIAAARIEKLKEMEKLLISNGLLDPDMQPMQMAQGAGSQAPSPMQTPQSMPPEAAAVPQTPFQQSPQSDTPSPVSMGESAPQESGAAPPEDGATSSDTPSADPSTDPSQQLEQPIDPFAQMVDLLSQEVPVKMLIDEHPVYIDTYREWLTTDDGQNASQIVQSVMERKMVEHFLAAGEVQSYMAMLAPPVQNAQGAPPSGGDPKKTESAPSSTASPVGQGARPQPMKGAAAPSPQTA